MHRFGNAGLQPGRTGARQSSSRRRDGKKKLATDRSSNRFWPGWRGANRDGRAELLPETLPSSPKFAWSQPTFAKCLAGVAADDRLVVYADRELGDTLDVFHGLDPKTGELKWSLRYQASGSIDYGNSPRASPLIHDGFVVTFGAFGDLHVLDAETGDVRWKKNITKEFDADAEMKWGTCSSPLVVDDLLIVNPGAKKASLVALRLADGSVAWKSPGRPASHSSFILAELGGKRQIVGYDSETLGGWDPKTGERLWEIRPPVPRDFNVPTPIALGDRLFVATENNGSRVYNFGPNGKPNASPSASNEELAPDSHSPVVVGNRVFGVWSSLHCLDLDNGLKRIWEGEDPAFRGYVSLIHDGRRLLATTTEGELLLIDGAAPKLRIISRLKLFTDDQGVYSHPALSDGKLFVRGSDRIVCLPLFPSSDAPSRVRK